MATRKQKKDMSNPTKEQAKQKLKTDIERSVQHMVNERIKNHIQDFTVLYVRRNKIEVDGESMVKILDAVAVALDDGYFKFVDEFSDRIKTSLDKFEEASGDPLAITGKKETTK